MPRPPALVLLAAVVIAARLPAQAHAAHHAEREQLGIVHFSTSCSPAVAPAFDRAIALLHAFELGDAKAESEFGAKLPMD